MINIRQPPPLSSQRSYLISMGKMIKKFNPSLPPKKSSVPPPSPPSTPLNGTALTNFCSTFRDN